MEGRVTKKLSQEFSGTESRILGALSKLGEINPQDRVHSGSVPKTPRNSTGENQETNGDHCQNYPHPEKGTSFSRSLKTQSRKKHLTGTFSYNQSRCSSDPIHLDLKAIAAEKFE